MLTKRLIQLVLLGCLVGCGQSLKTFDLLQERSEENLRQQEEMMMELLRLSMSGLHREKENYLGRHARKLAMKQMAVGGLRSGSLNGADDMVGLTMSLKSQSLAHQQEVDQHLNKLEQELETALRESFARQRMLMAEMEKLLRPRFQLGANLGGLLDLLVREDILPEKLAGLIRELELIFRETDEPETLMNALGARIPLDDGRPRSGGGHHEVHKK